MVEYNNFRVENEPTSYYLATLGAFCELSADGTEMGNALRGFDFPESRRNDIFSTNHERNYFSTFDRDNDAYVSGNCACEDGSGWWFNRCSSGKFYILLTSPHKLDSKFKRPVCNQEPN